MPLTVWYDGSMLAKIDVDDRHERDANSEVGDCLRGGSSPAPLDHVEAKRRERDKAPDNQHALPRC